MVVLCETVIDEGFMEVVRLLREKPEGKGLFVACSESPVLFSEFMLGIRLYDWQAYFLHKVSLSVADGGLPREFLALTSRQIGKSTSVAILALWVAVFNKLPGGSGNSSSVGVFSASDVQAKKLLHEVKKLIRLGDRHMFSVFGDKVGKTFFGDLLDEDEPNNTTTITFKGGGGSSEVLKGSLVGSVIKSYPPTSSVLGETFTLVVEDEAGKSERFTDQAHDEYISPTGDAFNAIRIYTSTPWTLSGFFYRLADPDMVYGETNVQKYLFTCEAIKDDNPVQYKVILDKVERLVLNGQKDVADRAYYCRFVKGEKNYFSPESVRSMFCDDLSPQDSCADPCDLGVDFGGKVVSRSVLTVSRLGDDGVVRRVFHKTYPVGQDDTLMEDIASLMGAFNVQRIIPDECPAGEYLIREMVANGWNVHPMNFRSEKVKKYGAFRASLNRGEVLSYNDDELRVEMNSLEFGQGSRQSVIKHAPGYSDDLIDSFVLSCYFFVSEDEGQFRYYDLEDYDDDEESWFGRGDYERGGLVS